jgi:hypothetical protein
MKIIAWQNNPDIGWWLDNEPLKLYFGCSNTDVPNIDRGGIRSLSTGPNAFAISVSLDPGTAYSKINSNVMQKDRAVLHVRVPLRWFMSAFDSDLSGVRDKQRLLDKDMYEKFTRSDLDYYKGFQVRIRSNIPRRFVVGVSYR